jgi:hypothetical protein
LNDSPKLLNKKIVVANLPRISIFVIVPGDKLDELRVEHDTSIGIEDGRAEVTFKIS